MWKRVLFWSLVSSLAWAAQALPVQASEGDGFVRVVGIVEFERHTTVIPMVECYSQPCGSTHVYWSVILRGESMFELDTVFALGSEVQPESVEVDGVVIRPGARVAMDAKVDTLTRDFAIISDVSNVSYITDENPVVY